MDDYKVEGSWLNAPEWDIFKKDDSVIPEKPDKNFWVSTYSDGVKERLRESVWEYLDDDQMVDKFVTDLQDVLTENYKESNDKATKIKSMMTKLFGNHVVF